MKRFDPIGADHDNAAREDDGRLGVLERLKQKQKQDAEQDARQPSHYRANRGQSRSGGLPTGSGTGAGRRNGKSTSSKPAINNEKQSGPRGFYHHFASNVTSASFINKLHQNILGYNDRAIDINEEKLAQEK